MLSYLYHRARNLVIHTTLRILRIFWPTLDALLKRIEQSPGIPAPSPSTSYWMKPLSFISTYGSEPNEKLPGYADVVIIGSGMTGASVARTVLDWQKVHWESVNPLQVVMLEARDACSGATGRNGGHIFPQLYADYTGLKREYGTSTAKQIIRFRLAHLPQLMAVAAEEGLLTDSQCREVQAYDVYHDYKLYKVAKSNLACYRADMPEESVDFRVHEAKDDLKDLRLSDRAIGCLSTRAGAMHPYRFVTGILSRLLRDYSTNFRLFTQTPCTAISSSQSDFRDLYSLVTPKGVIQTPHVVHATNAWASHLLPAMRRKIIPVRGVMTAQLRRALGEASRTELQKGTPEDRLRDSGTCSFVFFPGSGGHTYDYLTQQPAVENEAQQNSYPPPQGEFMFGGGFTRENTFLTEIGNTDDRRWNAKIGVYLKHALDDYFVLDKDDKVNEDHVKGLWSGIIGVSVDGRPWTGRIPTRVSGRKAPRIFMGEGLDDDGTRGMSSDAVSRLAAPGEWIAAGYSGEGMVHAWMSGKALAYMILDLDKGVKEKSGQEEFGVDLEEWFPNVFRISEERHESAVIEDLMVDFLTG